MPKWDIYLHFNIYCPPHIRVQYDVISFSIEHLWLCDFQCHWANGMWIRCVWKNTHSVTFCCQKIKKLCQRQTESVNEKTSKKSIVQTTVIQHIIWVWSKKKNGASSDLVCSVVMTSTDDEPIATVGVNLFAFSGLTFAHKIQLHDHRKAKLKWNAANFYYLRVNFPLLFRITFFVLPRQLVHVAASFKQLIFNCYRLICWKRFKSICACYLLLLMF